MQIIPWNLSTTIFIGNTIITKAHYNANSVLAMINNTAIIWWEILLYMNKTNSVINSVREAGL